MPTLGITDKDCEGDGSYGGHEDLLFKKMQFKTVLPLEKMRSAAVHTLISRKLRESSAALRHKESRFINRHTDDAWKSSFTPANEATQYSHNNEAQAIEEIANYYIKNALIHSQQAHNGVSMNPPSNVARVDPSCMLLTPKSPQPVVQRSAQPPKTVLPTFPESGGPALSQSSLSSANIPMRGTSLSLLTPMSGNVSVISSSSANEKSFDFTGSPLTTVSDAFSKANHLDNYNGARPSFGLGTLTSTPLAFMKKSSATHASSNGEIPKNDSDNENVAPEKNKDEDKNRALPEKSEESSKPPVQVVNTEISSKSFEDFYLEQMKLAEDYDLAKKRVEENKDQKVLRALTKRTIVEKVTVESKKTASLHEIATVSGFLCMLLNGKEVLGYGDKTLQLPEGDLRYYAFIITIESYMGVVERDPSLAVVISRILTLICGNVQQFEAVLMGKILRTSQLISLNEKKCEAYATRLAEIEDRRFALIPETSFIKLFIHLHVIGSASQRMSLFTSKALWRFVKFVTEENSRIMATAAILLGVIENGSNHLKMVDPKKWSVVLDRITNILLPRLETEVDEDALRRSIGEDAIVSSLRHAVLRRRSSG
ncbi:hypothetical protein V3C99_007767 [Haemonchus contortus]